MNIFQQVFASVDPKVAQTLRENDRNQVNRVVARQTEVEEPIKPAKPDIAEEAKPVRGDIVVTCKKSPVAGRRNKSSKPHLSPIAPSKKRPSMAKSIRMFREKHRKTEEEVLQAEPDETCVELSHEITEATEKLRSLDDAVSRYRTQNHELRAKCGDIEKQIALMDDAALQMHNRVKATKADLEERAAEREANLEFRATELLTRIEALKET